MEFLSLRLSIRISVAAQAAQLNLTRLHQPKIWSRQLRSAAEPSKVQHQLVEQKPEALMQWIGQLEQRFGAQGKILIYLEQSRGALIYHLTGYEFFDSIQLTRCSWLAIGRPLVRAEPRMTGLTRSCFVSCSIVIATGSEPAMKPNGLGAKLITPACAP
jgi:hypothetical protein